MELERCLDVGRQADRFIVSNWSAQRAKKERVKRIRDEMKHARGEVRLLCILLLQHENRSDTKEVLQGSKRIEEGQEKMREGNERMEESQKKCLKATRG